MRVKKTKPIRRIGRQQVPCSRCEYKGPSDQFGIHYCKHIGKWATDVSSCDVGVEV